MDMERQKKAASGGISVGSSSILVIFVVLALTAFAALSMTTAGSDLRLTRRVARATQEYYAADAQAVEHADALRDAFAAQRPETFPQKAAELGWTVNGLFANRSIPLGESQTLEITADFSQTPIRFTRWQVVNNADWEEQDSFSLWDGGLTALPAGEFEPGLTPPPLPGFQSGAPLATDDAGALPVDGAPAGKE